MIKAQQRFEMVVFYIEANLDQVLDLDVLCQQACLSRYHFHRQCSAYFGLPLASLVRLLRLKRAAWQLAYRKQEKVLQIALANGYDSHEAFSRSFKLHFLQSPSAFRKNPDWTPWLTHYDPIQQLRSKLMTDHSYQVELVDFPQTPIAVLPHRGAPHLLAKSIQTFISWRKQQGLPPSRHATFNLVYDDPDTTEAELYRFDLACELNRAVPDNNLGIYSQIIPAGRCALIRFSGSDDQLAHAVRYLYQQWLPETDQRLRDFPLYFQRISFYPDVPEHQARTDIYLPLAD